MNTPRKTAIAARFDAAHDYEQAASIQKRCARLLAERIRHIYAVPAPAQPPRRILEFGCGTGLLSRELAISFPKAALHLTDLAPTMLERTGRALADIPLAELPRPDRAGPNHPPALLQNQPRLFVMDGEAPSLPEGVPPGFDLITSSLCLQWFEDRPKAFRALTALLRPGGRLMVSTLTTGTLQQWRESCKNVSIPCGVPDYPGLARLQQDWPANGQGSWDICALDDPTPSARHFLKGLRMIGASLPRADHRPAAGLRQAMRHFDVHHDHVTYQVAFGLFQKEH